MGPKFLAGFAAALVFACVGWFLKPQPEVDKPKPSTNALSSVPAVPTAIEVNPINKQASGSQDHIDAATVHFRQGQFYLDESLRFYFEYFILRRGDLNDGQLLEQLKQDAFKRYNRQMAEYLLALFGRYLQYLNAMAKSRTDKPLGYDEVARIQERLQQRLFNEQEQWALFSNEYLKKYSNENSPQGKYERYLEQAKSLKSQEALDALRTETFGLEAAARFKALEQKRAKWQLRLQQYYCAKKQIQASPGIANTDKKQQVLALQQRMFDEPELTRVQALDKQNAMNIDENGC